MIILIDKDSTLQIMAFNIQQNPNFGMTGESLGIHFYYIFISALRTYLHSYVYIHSPPN